MTTHIHFIGICGTGMGSLAGLCKAAGHQVTGSDEHVYPPMSTQLQQLGIRIAQGYRPEHLTPRPDLVVIGNVITKANPEAAAAIGGGMAYRSMPDALAELFLADRLPIVIAGTHGKTTTAAIAAWLLEHAGRHPGFLIGGIPVNFGISCRIGAGREFVIEGDEYDTAFFDKTPKFLHYRPQAAVLGPIEFDHADIYRDLDHVKSAFRTFVERMPPHGLLAACIDSPHVRDVIRDAPCRVVTYSVTTAADYAASAIACGPDGARCTVQRNTNWVEYHSPLPGRHNLQNALGVLALLTELGLPAGTLQEGLARCTGVQRRQEVRGTVRDITVIDDFAHHPTAVLETVRALLAKYPGRRLLVAFEPRSNTSKRKVFQAEFATAFTGAHAVWFAPIHRAEKVADGERLDLDQLAAAVRTHGVAATACTSTDAVIAQLCRTAQPHDVIVCMSNGGFDDIHGKLLEHLQERR